MTVLVTGARILAALKARLETITEARSFPLTVTEVNTEVGEILFDIPAARCPLIEVISGDQRPDKINPGGLIEVETQILLRLVQPRYVNDAQMEEFQSSVMRCLYANSYTASQIQGIGLPDGTSNTIVYPKWVGTQPDYNMVDTNRIWVMEFMLKSQRHASSF